MMMKAEKLDLKVAHFDSGLLALWVAHETALKAH